MEMAETDLGLYKTNLAVLHRKPESYGNDFIDFLDGDSAMMEFHDLVDDRKSKSRSSLMSRVIPACPRLEEARTRDRKLT